MKSLVNVLALAALALGACAAMQPIPAPDLAAVPASKTVFVIRHLQKGKGDDPPLTAEGAANAERLADLLDDRGIAAIFATPTRRAMETAAPLSKRLGIAITPYDPKNPEALADSVAAVPGPVLVVGHSNTVHELVGSFGGSPPPPLSEEDYGTLFIVEADGGVSMLEVR
jgi:broad specificity phosphatase PhoE